MKKFVKFWVILKLKLIFPYSMIYVFRYYAMNIDRMNAKKRSNDVADWDIIF